MISVYPRKSLSNRNERNATNRETLSTIFPQTVLLTQVLTQHHLRRERLRVDCARARALATRARARAVGSAFSFIRSSTLAQETKCEKQGTTYRHAAKLRRVCESVVDPEPLRIRNPRPAEPAQLGGLSIIKLVGFTFKQRSLALTLKLGSFGGDT